MHGPTRSVVLKKGDCDVGYELKYSTSTQDKEISMMSFAPFSLTATRTRSRVATAAVVTALMLLVSLLSAAPAHAQGSRTISGNIACNAFPNVAIGTTATAKGTVELSMNQYNNAGSIGTVRVGASAAYAVWGWKWWSSKAGNYTAYAWGSTGAVSAANRYCQNIWS